MLPTTAPAALELAPPKFVLVAKRLRATDHWSHFLRSLKTFMPSVAISKRSRPRCMVMEPGGPPDDLPTYPPKWAIQRTAMLMVSSDG